MSEVLRPWILAYLHTRSAADSGLSGFDVLKGKKAQVIQFTTDGSQPLRSGEIWARISDKKTSVDVRVLADSVAEHERKHGDRITKLKSGIFFVTKSRPSIERIPEFKNGNWSLTDPRLVLEVDLDLIGGRGAGQVFGDPRHAWEDEQVSAWEEVLLSSSKPQAQANGHPKSPSISSTSDPATRTAAVHPATPPISSRSPTSVDDRTDVTAFNLHYFEVAEVKLYGPPVGEQTKIDEQLKKIQFRQRDAAPTLQLRSAREEPSTPPQNDVVLHSQASSALTNWSVSVKNEPNGEELEQSEEVGTQDLERESGEDDDREKERSERDEDEDEDEVDDEDEDEEPRGLVWDEDEVDELDDDDEPPLHTSSQQSSSDTGLRMPLFGGLGLGFETQGSVSGILSSSPTREQQPGGQPNGGDVGSPTPTPVRSPAVLYDLPASIQQAKNTDTDVSELSRSKDERKRSRQPEGRSNLPGSRHSVVSSPFSASQVPGPLSSPPSSSMPVPETPSQNHSHTPTQEDPHTPIGPERSPITPSRLPPSPPPLSSIHMTAPIRGTQSQPQSARTGTTGSNSTQSQDRSGASAESGEAAASPNPTGDHDPAAWKSPAFRRRTAEPTPSGPSKPSRATPQPLSVSQIQKTSDRGNHYRDEHDHQGYLAARLGLPADWEREIVQEQVAEQSSSRGPRSRLIAEVVIETRSPKSAKQPLRSEWRSDPNARQGLQARIDEASEQLKGSKRRAGSEEAGLRPDKQRRIGPEKQAASSVVAGERPESDVHESNMDQVLSREAAGESSAQAAVSSAPVTAAAGEISTETGASAGLENTRLRPGASEAESSGTSQDRGSSARPRQTATAHSRTVRETLSGQQIVVAKIADRAGIFKKRKRDTNSPFVSDEEGDKDGEEQRKAAAAQRVTQVANARFRFAKGAGISPPKAIRRVHTTQELARQVVATVRNASDRVPEPQTATEEAIRSSPQMAPSSPQERAPENTQWNVRSGDLVFGPMPASASDAHVHSVVGREEAPASPGLLVPAVFAFVVPPAMPQATDANDAEEHASADVSVIAAVSQQSPPQAQSSTSFSLPAQPSGHQGPQIPTGPPLAGAFSLNVELLPGDLLLCKTMADVEALIAEIDEWRASLR